MNHIASLYIEDNCEKYYFDGHSYFVEKENSFIKISKLHLAIQIGAAWNEKDNTIVTEQIDNKYKSTYNIPIYDWVDFQLFAYGITENEAEYNLLTLYNDLKEYYNKYSKNKEYNKRQFMKSVHKFAFFEHQIHYFPDSEKDFRELVVEIGVPNDARADMPIFGYIQGNNLVFFKLFFLGFEKIIFLDFINRNKKHIMNHYGLNQCNIYTNIKKCEQQYIDENKYVLDSLVDNQFDYLTPTNFLETITIK